MTFKIKEKEIELKYSIRAMIMYENITEKFFSPQSLTDIITFMYCVILSSAQDYTITFDEFIDFLDENPNCINDFSEWLKGSASVNNNLSKN